MMAGNVHELRPKAADSEKITINLGYIDLGHIELMVQEGFYSNRTDFIRTAIRNQIERHADVVRQSVARKSIDLGLRHYGREDLEAAQAAGRMLEIRVLGLASIGKDVRPRRTAFVPQHADPAVTIRRVLDRPALDHAIAERLVRPPGGAPACRRRRRRGTGARRPLPPPPQHSHGESLQEKLRRPRAGAVVLACSRSFA
jgi:Arc/MetJ-type ribon-helix-helix transcriptional regulator